MACLEKGHGMTETGQKINHLVFQSVIGCLFCLSIVFLFINMKTFFMNNSINIWILQDQESEFY